MVTTLAEQVGKSQTIYVTDFTGLNVANITDLRRRLRAVGVEYVVVKNTLARRALSEKQLKDGGLESFLAGPTALVLAGAESGRPREGADGFRQGIREAGDQGSDWSKARRSRRRR